VRNRTAGLLSSHSVMLTDGLKASLDDAWRPARRAGVLGNASTEELWEHTAGFTSAVCSAFSADCSTWNGHILDAGTGAGVPGVLLACQLPMANFVLVDSSERRLDHVRAAIRAAALGGRIQVEHARLDDLAHQPAHRARYEVVVARLLAEPPETAELILPFVAPGGVAVVSCRSDQADDWRRLGDRLDGVDTVMVAAQDSRSFVTVAVSGELPPSYPRRAAVRARKPLQ